MLNDDLNSAVNLRSTRNPLIRLYGRGDLHFITFSCYRRLPFLGDPQSRDCFLRILNLVRVRHRFQLFGYVVMPEHVHLLLSEPPKVTPSIILQVLKQKVSGELTSTRDKLVRNQRVCGAGRRTTDDPPFWQRRFYDFNVWNPAKIKEKLDYMHGNPVKRNLVGHPKDWPWSSWSYYATGKEGLLRIDSFAEVDNEAKSKPAPLKPKGAAPDFHGF